MRRRNQDTMNTVLTYINEYYMEHGTMPSTAEIGFVAGISKASVSRYVRYLEEAGKLSLNGRWGDLETKETVKMGATLSRVPVVGDIACGTPILAEENIESYLTISADFLGNGRFFALKARGNSMINAGINDGDYVVVRQQCHAEEGQIVVALIEDSATLKRLFFVRETKKYRLHPENKRMRDIYCDNLIVQGVAVKVIKDLI